MTDHQKYCIEFALERASRDKKGDLAVYECYKALLQDLNLTAKEYEQTIRKLMKVMRI